MTSVTYVDTCLTRNDLPRDLHSYRSMTSFFTIIIDLSTTNNGNHRRKQNWEDVTNLRIEISKSSSFRSS